MTGLRNSVLLLISGYCLIYLYSCKQEEPVENYYGRFSCGVLSSQHIDHQPNVLDFKVNMFILDSENDLGLTSENINAKLSIFSGAIQEWKIETTPYKGDYSCIVLINDFFNAQFLGDYLDGWMAYNPIESSIRKYLYRASGNNEFTIATFRTNRSSFSFLSDSFRNDAQYFNLPLAAYCSEMRPEVDEQATIPLLYALDSCCNFLVNHAKHTEKHIILFYPEINYKGAKFEDDIDLQNDLIEKFKNSGIHLHLINSANLSSMNLYEYRLMKESGGSLYSVNSYSGIDLMLFSEKLDNILTGGFDYFETTWKIVASYNKYSNLYTDLLELNFIYYPKDVYGIDIPFYIDMK